MNLQKFTDNFKSIFCGGIFDSDHMTKNDYQEKTLRQLGSDTQCIVVGFTKTDEHPVCQTIHDFQTDMSHHDHLNDKTFFTLNKKVVGKLEYQKTYQIAVLKKTLEAETYELRQVSMFITADSTVG